MNAQERRQIVLTGSASGRRVRFLAEPDGSTLMVMGGGAAVGGVPLGVKFEMLELRDTAGAPASCAVNRDATGAVIFYYFEKVYLATPLFRLRFDDGVGRWCLYDAAGGTEVLFERKALLDFPPLESLEVLLLGAGEALPPAVTPRASAKTGVARRPRPRSERTNRSGGDDHFAPAGGALPPQSDEDPQDAPLAVLDALADETQFAPFKGGAPAIVNVGWDVLYPDGTGTFFAEFHALRADLLQFALGCSDGVTPAFVEAMDAQPVVAATTGGEPVWFIGDVHGDLPALKILTDAAFLRDGPGARVFLLGDLIDGAPFSVEVMAWTLAAARGISLAGRTFTLSAVAGNHDDAFGFDADDGHFFSSVLPSDFHLRLNRAGADLLPFGKVVCEFFRRLPRMVVLDKTVIAAHAGFPNRDLLPLLNGWDDLASEKMLFDFVWTRLHPTLPEKLPNRRRLSPAAGSRDLDRFAALLGKPEFLGRAPSLMLRGHDHVPDNCAWFERYARCKAITLNAFCFDTRVAPETPRPLRAVRWVPAVSPTAPLDISVFSIEPPPDVFDAINDLFFSASC